ncbi:MAG: 50S ribosomal protein L5 [Candidatus Aenigmatarchaeota archaeon]
MTENPMRQIRIEKVTVNMGAGEAGAKLDNSVKLIEKLTGAKIVITKTHKRTTFGGPKKKPIGAKTTLRGKKAEEFLELMLKAVENKLRKKQFDVNGNFSFGIKEYIDIPGVKYDPDIGIMGMDICVTLQRPGYRVKNRKINQRKIGMKHNIKKEDSMEFMKTRFKVEVV